jgi:phospholipid/cholesterol/gamma-HCH transport system substrate-binding protein
MIRKAIGFALFAALSITLTVFIGAQIANLQLGTQRYALTATFTDATNLRPGDPVRLAGVPIGTVSGVRVVEGQAAVSFSIDTDIVLPDDSEVAVAWLNLIGQRELYLYPGSSSTSYSDGDEVDRTRSVVDLGALLDELGPLTSAIDPAQVNQLVEALVTALSGNREEIADVVDQLATVLGTLDARRDTVTQLVDDYETITGAVSRRDLEIQQMLDNLALLSGAFADSGNVLEQALTDLPDLAVRLQQLLDQNATELGTTLDQLALVTDTVRANLADVSRTFDGLPDALQLVFGAVSRGHYILVNAVCLAPNAPPCPHPVLLTAQAQGAGSLTTTDAFRETLLGVGP